MADAFYSPYSVPEPGLTAHLAHMRIAAEPAADARAVQSAHRPLVLAVDYDLTLDLAPWPAVGKLAPGALEVMRHFKEQGHTLIIWTCRSGDALEAAVAYLRLAGVPFDYVNENTPERIAEYGCDCRKISADVYLDDKAAGAPLFGYDMWRAYRLIVDFKAKQLA